MESAAKIRRLILRDGKSIRSVNRSLGVSRNTIRKYLKDDEPPFYHRKQPPVLRKLAAFEGRLIELFEQDTKRPKRERRTAKQLYEKLVGEGYTGSYYPVCRFVRRLKSDASQLSQAFIPLHFKSGDALQFDWSEEHIVLDGVECKIKLAHFRLCHSRKTFLVAYPNEVQEMVLDAFIRALIFYGGVPRRVIIDNPKTMVTFVSRSKERKFHPRFLALMNHYVIEPVACTPASGWEKGQVERQVQDIRHRLFTPKLKVDDLQSLNDWLLLHCQNELGSRPHPEQKDQTIDALFEKERGALRPLGRAFDGILSARILSKNRCPLFGMRLVSKKPCECVPPALFNMTAIATAFRPNMLVVPFPCGSMRSGLLWLPIRKSSPGTSVASRKISAISNPGIMFPCWRGNLVRCAMARLL